MTTAPKKLYNGDTFECNGRTFRVRYKQDNDAGMPWVNEEGRGIVRTSNYPHYDGMSDKHPGERPMNRPDRNEWQFYYDWQATIKKARSEGWGLHPDDIATLAAKLGRDPTKREIVAESVRRDYEFCSYCVNDDIPYVGVIVELLGPENEEGERETVAGTSTWGIETFRNYHMTYAYELVAEVEYERAAIWRKALKEARERRYWASRDIVTEGV